MKTSHSEPCIFGHRERQQARRHGQSCRPDWRSLLPSEWLHEAVAPAVFRVFREFEMPARRVLGYDSANRPCYCSYDYRLVDLRSDDDEDFYEALVYGESLTAWRLRDERWLIHRRMEPLGEEGAAVSGFTLEDRMPR